MLRGVIDKSDIEHLMALAFSAVATLVERMGEEQAWVAIPAKAMETVRGSCTAP
ncbi:hypothetical protein [Actinacidiphila oryziradicis]|uniref:hypothetical protein n=1 Tax=Actinacidiphila oryziradicis TaxID=2571141 RepID=UPI0023F11660|nr:hypothetical protein [Actinacidiphila oryziradicis]MCW2875899.1 hypothetical protein [Actinacidiphila oryziradicis]MDX6328548.1 hypothetical protein [Streptomycetaceae bacterium]